MDSKHILLIFSLLFSFIANSQALEELSLLEAYELLEARYPALRNGQVLTDIQAKQQEQLLAERKPGIYLKADAQLQSESVNLDGGEQLPLNISRPLGSAKTFVEADYLLLDGGLQDARSNLINLQATRNQQELEVQRFGLRGQVNRWFLQVQSLRSQADIFELSLADLAARKEQIAAAVTYGTMLESELIKITVKEKQLQAQQSDLNYRLQAALNSLTQLLGASLDENTRLVFPALASARNIPNIDRPELALFELQRAALLGQNALVEAERGPKLRLFAQAGVGYPNPLNLLDSDPAPYGILGAGFSWKIIDWDKTKMQQDILSLQAQQLQNQEESFRFNLDQQTASYLAEVDRLEAQIINNQEIAELEAEILVQLAAQLDGGVITATDYLVQLNAELLARQQIIVHQVALQQVQLKYWSERGGF